MPNEPIAFFITFTTFGTWLHGQEKGSVDRTHNMPDSPVLPANPIRELEELAAMGQLPYRLDSRRRRVVLATIREVCQHRGWQLLACHVRTNHVHIIVHANAAPEKVMNDVKAYASRRLTEAGLDDKTTKRWTRHGSTRYLWEMKHLSDAIDYVLNRQGETMETYQDLEMLSALDSESRP